MMFGLGLFFLMFTSIMVFVAFGIPVLVGILVYRDADKRIDCSPWLWALVAALVPSFIGLIIYVIIRNDYPLKAGAQGFADNYEQRYDENGNPIENPHRGFPTWAKVLLILGAILVVVGMIAGCGMLVSGIKDLFVATPEYFYYDF